MVDLAAKIWADGPVSSPLQPDKRKIRDWGTMVENAIAAFVGGGGYAYSLKSTMDADLAKAPATVAWVIGDPVVANNGIYRKNGSSGFGSWFRMSDLPFSFIPSSNAGSGTANAIIATSSLPVSESALVVLPIVATNTASPVTVSFNATTSLTIKTASGNNVAVGGLVAGTVVMGYRDGTTFRMLSDQASTAIQAAAEAAKLAAEAARDATQAYMSSVVLTEFATVAAAQAYSPSVAPAFIRTAGYYAGGDGGEALYQKVVSAPSHAGKFSITLSGGGVQWYEIAVTTANVKQFGAKGDGTTDDRAACQAAVAYVVSKGGGDLHFPTGTYRLVGAANADGLANGIVIPFQNYTISNRVRLVSTGKATLKAASNNMVVVRMSQPGSELIGLEIDGGYDYSSPGTSLSGTVGIGMVAENRNQTTTLVSQSFCKVFDCHVRNCTEGLILEAGPDVAGSGSGCFYPVIAHCDFNLNRRAMWFKSQVNAPTNRPTRGNIIACRIERGNTGIDFEQVTEFNVVGCYLQFLKSTYATAPYADGAGMRVGPLTENVTVVGWESEQADYDFYLDPACLPNAVRVPLGSNLGGVSSGFTFAPIHAEPFLRLTRRSAAYEQMHISANFSGFARLVFDWDANGTRDANIDTNGSRRMSWFNGKTTHYGSAGNIELLSTGATINGTASTGLTVTTSGTNLALTAGGKSLLVNASGVQPGADNTTSNGIAGARWSVVYAATGTINTSDARHKATREGQDIGEDGSVSPMTPAELAVAKQLSKIIGIYKWRDAIRDKGNDARLHAGVTVQAVVAVFAAEGLNAFDYGVVGFDEWEAVTEPVTRLEPKMVLNEDGELVENDSGEMVEVETGEFRIVRPAGNIYSVRPDELWAFVAAGFEARIAALEAAA